MTRSVGAGLTIAMALLMAAPASWGQPRDADPQNGKTAALRQNLERRLSAITASLDGVLGYAVIDLTTGERFTRLPDEVFPTASTIKLAILYELFKQEEEGRIRLEESRTLERRHAVAGSGVLFELTTPTMSLRDYATLMIVLSDNTATNILIDALGMDRVTARMATLGLENTKLRRRMLDQEAARRGDENVSTPEEIARLLEIMFRSTGLTPKSQQALLDILKKPKSTALRQGVPASVEIAGKPGSLEGVAVDAGIVYLDGRPYILAAMASYLPDASAGDRAIADVSRAVFGYFAVLARSSEYGRRLR